MTDLEGAVARAEALSAGNKSWAPHTATPQHAYDLREDAKAIDTILDALASITRERDAYALTMAEARAQVEIVHKALIKTDRDDEDPTQVAIDRASNLLDLDEGQRLLRERDAMRKMLGDAEADLATLISKFSYFDDGEPKDWSEWQSARATLARIRAAALVNGEGG